MRLMKSKETSFSPVFLAFCAFFTVLSCIFTQNASSFFLSEQSLQSGGLPSSAVFFGESTTTHWQARGSLPKHMVWANESGTMRLDSTLLSRKISDPETGASVSFADALKKYQPPYLILSFGLNGIQDFSKNRELYIGNYRKLIEYVLQNSPKTEILLQTVYPVARAEYQTDWNFSESPEIINQKIMLLNQWLEELCHALDTVRLLDTAAVLRDSNGYLSPTDTTDGIHLTSEAYEKLRSYIDEHFQSSIKPLILGYSSIKENPRSFALFH